jgi:hypothetical protein
MLMSIKPSCVVTGAGIAIQSAVSQMGKAASEILLTSGGLKEEAAYAARARAISAPRNGLVIMGVGMLQHDRKMVAVGGIHAVSAWIGDRQGARIGAELAAGIFRR